MATIKLGQRPVNFKHVIRFQDVDGTNKAFGVVYRYRTRKEFAAFIDELVAAGKAAGTFGPDEQPTMTELFDRSMDSNGSYLMNALEGWDLDIDFNLANAQQLADEYPGAVQKIMHDYRSACVDGSLGN